MTTNFFRIDYSAGLTGFALFTMANGEVRGTDVGGLSYRGEYSKENGVIFAEVSMTIPAGTQLVTGQCPQPISFAFNINFDESKPTQQVLDLPIGQIQVAITPLP
ncbi:hypothetical protein [Aliivibrio fischeri]|uniref:hypothetical protein n=1 Tax=Aliivibrio fischeri TaxID=668 RepID=UPI00080ED083|nr:hypothetical protein [Aliivibrio fischeri]OCH37477.1 hypothetical protein A6E02_18625 [Aliivibrio fischeri]